MGFGDAIIDADLFNGTDKRKRINVRKTIKEDIAKIGGEQVVIPRQRLWGRRNPVFFGVTYKDAQQRSYQSYAYVSFNSYGMPCRLEWREPPAIDNVNSA